VLAAAPASAEPAGCSVLDLNPKTIEVGVDRQTPVVFDVVTDCPADSVVHWYLTFDQVGATGPYTGPILANFVVPPGSRPISAPGGAYTWNVTQYPYAGPYRVTVNAFLGDDADNIDLPRAVLPISVLHRTTFGTSFDASPKPRRVGQTININGRLTYANWNTAGYDGLSANVMLQFRPAGSAAYQDVKLVSDNGSGAATTVPATRTGSWRYFFPGDPATGTAASYSRSDTVVVFRRR
jgi:hypothetical protein